MWPLHPGSGSDGPAKGREGRRLEDGWGKTTNLARAALISLVCKYCVSIPTIFRKDPINNLKEVLEYSVSVMQNTHKISCDDWKNEKTEREKSGRKNNYLKGMF